MKNLVAVLLMWAALPVFSADFVNQKTNQDMSLTSNADVQIINFWASYCKPCLKEMPEMSHWFSRRQGKKPSVAMVGVALDSKENIAKFLQKTPVRYDIVRYTGNNSRQMMRSYGNTIGALPYTVVRAKCGQERAIMGEVDSAKLDKAVAAVMAQCRQ